MYYLFKLSGSLVKNKNIVEKLIEISMENDITVVHGCGEQFSKRLDEFGISYKKGRDGKRNTSAEAIGILPGIVYEINHELAESLSRFKRFSERPISVKAEKFPEDYRGEPIGIRLPDYRNCIVGSLGIDENMLLLNVDADDVAGCLAENINYDRIVYITKKQNTYGKSSKGIISRRTGAEIIDDCTFSAFL